MRHFAARGLLIFICVYLLVTTAISSFLKKHRKNNCLFHIKKVLSAYRLGKLPATQRPDKRSILVRLDDVETVQEVVKASRTVRPEGLFFSENLTPKRHAILQALRRVRRDHRDKISSCTSIRGQVLVWLKPASSTGRDVRMKVNNSAQFTHLCENILNVSTETFLNNNE